MPASKQVTVQIWRGGSDGEYRDYQVPLLTSQTVLDLLTDLQRHVDTTLSYRFACRVGMCGSCAVRINDRAGWACRTLVTSVVAGGRLTLAPLANLPIIKDLVCDMQPFIRTWQDARGIFEPGPEPASSFAPIPPNAPRRQRVDAAIECINCGCCHSACDVVAAMPSYLGPAALNRAWTLTNDDRDQGDQQRLRAIAVDGGCHNCHSNHQCSARCPMELNPAASIAGLKKSVAAAVLKGRL